MFGSWAGLGRKSEFGFQTREPRAQSRMLRQTPRAIRNTIIILLLLTSFLTLQLLAGQKHWSSNSAYASDNDDPSTPRVAIVAFITKPQSYIHLGLQNKHNYAKIHGYDLFVDYESDSERGTTWLKFDMVERIIRAGQHDWVWYMDFDILITNTSMSLTNIISDSLANATTPAMVDFLVTDDCNGLNDGSFIVRSSSRSIKLLDEVRAYHDREKLISGKGLSDQDSMDLFLKSNVPLTQHAMRIPQWKINAFPTEIGCYDKDKRKWERGMFVVHFAGAWAHVSGEDPTGQLMRKYEAEIL